LYSDTGNIIKLTLWCRVLEKQIVIQLVKQFTAFHGNKRFITVGEQTLPIYPGGLLCNVFMLSVSTIHLKSLIADMLALVPTESYFVAGSRKLGCML
jgi:hypothetical protein